MTIRMTQNAAKQIQEQLARRGKGVGLRIDIKKVGCSGHAYAFDYADEMRAGDRVFESYAAKVVVDAGNLEILEGATLDFVKEGLKQTFKLDNPNVDATCGCGESFSVKTPITNT